MRIALEPGEVEVRIGERDGAITTLRGRMVRIVRTQDIDQWEYTPFGRVERAYLSGVTLTTTLEFKESPIGLRGNALPKQQPNSELTGERAVTLE